MSLYFKSEEDTMTNEIFLRLYIPPPMVEEKYVFTKYIEEFYKLLKYFSNYTYYCMFFNYTIIIDRNTESSTPYKWFIEPQKNTKSKNNLSNK